MNKLKLLFWLLIDHKHAPVENPDVLPPLRCTKCQREIVFDGEWSVWVTATEYEVKRKRKNDFSRQMGEVMKRYREDED